jgi:hypothetical protein
LVGLELASSLLNIIRPKLLGLSELEALQSDDEVFYTFTYYVNLFDDDNCRSIDIAGLMEVEGGWLWPY